MPTIQMSKKTSVAKRLAIYPGAFRPPHEAHLSAALDLVSRPDVDEVLVIISNRFRRIPGTTKALTSEVSRQIWEVYLQNIEKVRVEVAKHTAVQHALDYLDRANPGDTLLFCIGETDLKRGDTRFNRLTELAAQTGVTAVLVAASTASITVRSTDLRKILARGSSGRIPFMASLPNQLGEKQREQVWSICYEGMREISDILREEVRVFIERKELGQIIDICCVREGKLDPVFRVQFEDGRCYFVKYAGGTVESGHLGQKLSHKPRKRLAAERRALKRLRMNKLDDEIDLPEVVMFDQRTLSLVLTEVCPEGRTLLDYLKKGRFDSAVARTATRFLAKSHRMPGPINPVWGASQSDQAHWKRMLDLLTIGAEFDGLLPQARKDLVSLRGSSDQASEKVSGSQLLILDFSPKNILLGKGRMGVVDLELCSTIGDPAYDLGFFLGNYLFWGIITTPGDSAKATIEEALYSYQKQVEEIFWQSMCSRVLPYAGATILYQLSKVAMMEFKGSEICLSDTAAALLSMGFRQTEKIRTILSRAITSQLI